MNGIVIDATNGKVEKKPCKWKPKCTTTHELDPPFPYPNDGVAERKGLSKWMHPSANIGIGPHVPVYKGPLTAPNYAFQRHHVIPCGVFRKLPNISANLILVGFDINKEDLNGISLPTMPDDIVWHGLQNHRGYHKLYSDHVFRSLKNFENQVVDLCKTDEQGLLWEEIERKVSNYKKRILNWEAPLLYASSKIKQKAAFAKMGISIP